jgi:eukaryotic-like serine/threonine-protein kinase
MPTGGFWLFNQERQTWYFAVRSLGDGGFASVWAGQTQDGQSVAIKVIKRTANPRQDFSSWDTDQLVHLLVWHHPHVVQTLDQFVSPDGDYVIVMEMGQDSLDSLINQGHKWSDKDVCAIGWQILSALSELHARNVVHRDLTLKNIISFPGGIFKLCDFGISKPNVQPWEYAQTLIGTPSYIPPELYMEGYTTHQSDIYQVGLVLLTLIIGQHPIPPHISRDEIQKMILAGVPRQKADSLARGGRQTARILARMLPRHLANRYKTAAEAIGDLQAEYWRLQRFEESANLRMLDQVSPYR